MAKHDDRSSERPTMVDAATEFDRQVTVLLAKGYAMAVGMTQAAFKAKLAPLKGRLDAIKRPYIDLDAGHLPFVIVIPHALVANDVAMGLVGKDGKRGLTKLHPLVPEDFKPIGVRNVPNARPYLLIDIDRGRDTLDVTPERALRTIRARRRTPLTIDEGIAIVTHHPGFLRKNNCFSLLASRHPGDKRVPAIWINAAKRPNLGWCWDGNPHTWLGSASAKRRVEA